MLRFYPFVLAALVRLSLPRPFLYLYLHELSEVANLRVCTRT
jgi:hypothetical protein